MIPLSSPDTNPSAALFEKLQFTILTVGLVLPNPVTSMETAVVGRGVAGERTVDDIDVFDTVRLIDEAFDGAAKA